MPETHAAGAGAIEIAHIAYTLFPADTRVKREALAATRTGRRVAVVALRGPGQPGEEVMDSLTVIRLPGQKSRGGPFSYLAEYASFVWRCQRLLATDPRFAGVGVVHVHTLPDFLIWAAAPARRRGARIILDLHEIFPEFAAAKYPGALGRAAAWIARRVERAARRAADVTVTVNAPIEELLASRAIGRPERRILLHNSPDPEDFGAIRPPALQPLRDRLELAYHGSLTPLYGLDIAVRGVSLMAQRGLPVHLTILGDGPQRRSLEHLVASLGAGHYVTFEAPIPQRALPNRLAGIDAGVVPTRLDGMTRYSLSNKLLEYIHLGLPILASQLPSYSRYLGEDAVWYWVAGDAADFARAITEFHATPPAQRQSRVIQAQKALDRIAWPRERDQLVDIYEDLLHAS